MTILLIVLHTVSGRGPSDWVVERGATLPRKFVVIFNFVCDVKVKGNIFLTTNMWRNRPRNEVWKVLQL